MSLTLRHQDTRPVSAVTRHRAVLVRAVKPDAEVANSQKVTPRLSDTSNRVEQHIESSEPSGASRIVDVFLHRAASNLTRGTTTCLSCKGAGACNCPACQGHGILKPQAARMDMVQHAVQRVSMLLGMPRAAYNVDWLQSNRCRRCHGQGTVPCEFCNGAGIRHPQGGRKLVNVQTTTSN